MAFLLMGTSAGAASAASFTLVDGNSQVGLDDRNGITTWFVDGGRDNVFISNFYLRIGGSGNEAPLLALLGAPAAAQPSSDRLTLTFAGASLTAVLDYQLDGGTPGSSRSLLARSLTLTNTGSAPLDLHLFDYTDLDIRFNQAAQRDQSVATSPGRIVTVSADQPLSIVTEATPAPNHYQIDAFFPLYTSFFVDLDGPTTLDDTPALGGRFPVPPGDNAFAFQWDRLLGPDETLSVSTISRFAPVPAPAPWLLVAGGVLMLGLRSARNQEGKR